MASILVVEDSDTQAQEIRIVLQAAGHAIELAPDGREGLATFRSRSFDLVVSDVLMPHVSGFELCRTIKDETPEVPVILLTGLDDPTNVLRGYEAGANGFIVKPYEPEHLVNRVHDVLSPLWAIRERISSFLVSAFEDLGRAMEAKHQAEVREMNARASLALQASEMRFGRAFEATPIGMALTHPEGRFLRTNPALCDILGYSEPELLERTYTDVTHPGDREKARAYLERCRTGPHPGKLEARYVRKDGQTVLGELTVARMHDAEGTYTGDLRIVEDVTERRRVEEQFRQAQKMEAVGRLAGGIAHDFNNVLTAIIGYSNLAISTMPPDNPYRPDTEAILKAAQRATALTKQLLSFSRPGPVVLRPTELNSIVRDVLGMLGRLLGADIELVTHLTEPLGRVRVDPGTFTQVILNLAVNARDAMPNGGRLTIETCEAELDGRASGVPSPVRPGPCVILAVTDTGHGMSSETMSHVFEPFYTTKERGKGTGLGLATVYGIVKQVGGQITVASEPGHGTTFRICLPRAQGSEPHSAAAPSVRPDLALVGGTETILVVDDEESVRHLAGRILRKAGYTVLEAEDGEAALATLGQLDGPLHLLLSDVVMPKLGGVDLYLKMRQLRPAARLLLISGYADVSSWKVDLTKPGWNFLRKPFEPTELARRVREALDGTEPQ
ncbi:MAG: response regulator [Candidatus Wallbacteria bacterium]|nr:response regulator [Candidatus Wallbacteria bacterium]